MSNRMIAAFSDVHSNLEALNAVLADMDELGIHRRVCLGDIVGYAADPGASLKRVRALKCPVLQGNHDEAVAQDTSLEEMNTSAQAGIQFSRAKLSPAQRAWLAALPLKLTVDDCEFVHGSLDAPAGWWYVITPEDASLHFEAQTSPICFCGHTHDPMVWHWNGAGKLTVRHGEGRIPLPDGGQVLINVGSVGQPRDRNPDACYALFNPEDRWVEFRRIPYDVSKTMRKILKAKLPRFSAERLLLGK